jgi:hypothetical protein
VYPLHFSRLLVQSCAILCFESTVSECLAQVLITNSSYVESYDDFSNPERGFFTTTNPPFTSGDVGAFETTSASWTPIVDEAALRSQRITTGVSLHAMRYTLANFRSSDLSSTFLTRLGQDLGRARRAGVKIILRFCYGFQGQRPDASKVWVLRHLDQLRPVLVSNSDVISHVDAGFIGNWGEWHDSTNQLLAGQYGTDVSTDAREIISRLFSTVPINRMVAFRYPQNKSQYFKSNYFYGTSGALNPWFDSVPMPADSQAFDGSYASRAGNYNDSFMANDYDGTYGYDSNTRDTIKPRVSSENRYVVQSGEMDPGYLQTNTLATPARMRQEGSYMRWSCLNRNTLSGISPNVQSWIDSGDYPSIARSLGYRFVLLVSRVTEDVKVGGTFQGGFDIKNVGWATPFNPRPINIVLRHTITGSTTILTPSNNGDPRRWTREGSGGFAWNTVWISKQLPPTIAEGTYDLILHLPAPESTIASNPAYAIRLSNAGLWQSSNGYNLLPHKIRVTKP